MLRHPLVSKAQSCDEQRRKVTGAQVTVRSEAGMQLSTATDEAGVFKFKGLSSGNYLIEVRANGFSIYSHDDCSAELVRKQGAERHAGDCVDQRKLVVITDGRCQSD